MKNFLYVRKKILPLIPLRRICLDLSVEKPLFDQTELSLRSRHVSTHRITRCFYRKGKRVDQACPDGMIIIYGKGTAVPCARVYLP